MTDDPTFVVDEPKGILGFLKALKSPIKRLPDSRFSWIDKPEYQRVIPMTELGENDAYIRLPDNRAFLIGQVNGNGPVEHVYDPDSDSWRAVL